MKQEKLFDFLTSTVPNTEQELSIWAALASQYLWMTKQDPFRNHSEKLNVIEEMAKQYEVTYPIPQILQGMEFVENLKREELTNEEIKQRADEFTETNSGRRPTSE